MPLSCLCNVRNTSKPRCLLQYLLHAMLCMVLVFLAACANPLLRLAQQHQLDAPVVTGKPFLHQLFINKRYAYGNEPLHIYLDGDGRPWQTPTRVSVDPTPQNALLLKLMLLDPAPAIYLGRPCYFLLDDPQCSPIWWTMQRYSPEVIESINAVIDQKLKPNQKIVLIGYSGGGSLAMLVAEKRNDITAVLTLAANLDTERWNSYHHYSQLVGSLNPATQAPLAAKIEQLHLFGGKDNNTPKFLAERALSQQVNSEVKIYPDFDHQCCWTTIWPDILNLLRD